MYSGWAVVALLLAAVAVGATIVRFIAAVRVELKDDRPITPMIHAEEPISFDVTRFEAVDVLLSDMKDVVATRAADEKHLDGKAAQLLALVGGGAGVVAVVGSKADSRLIVTPLMTAGLLCLAVVILACVRVLAPRTRNRGSIQAYMKPQFLNRHDSDMRLTYELVKRYHYMARFYGWLTAVKGAYYFAGIFAFVVAVFALVANAIIPLDRTASVGCVTLPNSSPAQRAVP